MLPKGTLLSNPTQPRMGILVHIRHMMHSIKMLPKGTLLSPPTYGHVGAHQTHDAQHEDAKMSMPAGL